MVLGQKIKHLAALAILQSDDCVLVRVKARLVLDNIRMPQVLPDCCQLCRFPGKCERTFRISISRTTEIFMRSFAS